MNPLRSPLGRAALMAVLAFLLFRLGIRPPIPSSLLYMFMGITLVAILIYMSSDEALWREFLRPIKATLVDRDRRVLRRALMIAFPILVGLGAFLRVSPSVQPPAELRTVHPAPPTSIQFQGKTVDIQGLENPLRHDAANLGSNIQEGAQVYFSNCFFCHGDALSGKGHFADGLNPRPADFTDTGTIAQLQESYLFWRISKGGPGLPKESAPWSSAMPAFEAFLTEEEIWKVILYVYDAAGVSPRTWE